MYVSSIIQPFNVEFNMNNDTFNMSIRQFLKMVGINSQREIASKNDPCNRRVEP